MSVSRIFSSLEGAWCFTRVIPGQSLASGVATFVRLFENQLNYREEGAFQNGSTFYREYIYSYREDVISVLFDNRSLFQILQFQNPSLATATHECAPDTYTSEYRFLDSNRFQILHKVRGPYKDYEIETTFYKE